MRWIAKLCALLALLIGLSGCTPVLGSSMTVTAYLPDSAGLFVGNDVGVLGVPVGTVSAIEPDGARVKVTLSIEGDQPIPADAGAVVVARSVATDRYVELTPVYHEGARMQDGAVISADRTRTPVDFDEVLEALNTFARDIGGSGPTKNAIKRFLKAGSESVQGRGKDVNRAITSLGGAVDTISGQRATITSAVNALDKLTATVAANQQLAREFISQVADVGDLLAQERVNFRSSMRSLTTAVELVAAFAREHRKKLSTSLNLSTAVMKSIMSKRAELEDTLRVMPLALENLRATLRGDRVLVRVDIANLLPLGGLLDTVCSAAPVDYCAAFGPSLLNLNNLLALLGLG